VCGVEDTGGADFGEQVEVFDDGVDAGDELLVGLDREGEAEDLADGEDELAGQGFDGVFVV